MVRYSLDCILVLYSDLLAVVVGSSHAKCKLGVSLVTTAPRFEINFY